MADGLMANPYLELLNLGVSPEQAQQQIDQQRALQFANMNPQQRMAAGIYGGLQQVARAFGAKDPMLEQASQIRALQQQFDTQTSEGLSGFARALEKINPAAAMQAGIMARQLAIQEATLGKTKAETAKTELSVQQEEKLRQELAALPDNATEEDMLRVVRKYGKPGDIMKGIETAQARRATLEDKAAAREENWRNRKEELQMRHEQSMRELQQRGADRFQLQQMQQQFMASLKDQQRNHELNMFKLKQESQGAKPLSASLQKSEDTDLAGIQNAVSSAETIERPLQALKDGTLKLGLGQNFANAAKNAFGRSDPASQAFADLERSVQAATNIKVAAEKGVQTDKDVLRFAKELEAAYGKNDNKVMLQALENFKEAALKDAENKKKLINSRRKSQNVGAYDFTELVTPTSRGTNDGWSAVQR